jgi:hypothetical protein
MGVDSFKNFNGRRGQSTDIYPLDDKLFITTSRNSLGQSRLANRGILEEQRVLSSIFSTPLLSQNFRSLKPRRLDVYCWNSIGFAMREK